MHLHLPDNSSVTLRLLAQVVDDVIADILTDRALAEAAALAEDEELAEATVVVEAAEASEAAVETEFAVEPEPVQAEAEVAEVPVEEGDSPEA